VLPFNRWLGQGEEVNSSPKAQALGIKETLHEDLRENCAATSYSQCIRLHISKVNNFCTSIARSLIAKRLIEIAKRKQAQILIFLTVQRCKRLMIMFLFRTCLTIKPGVKSDRAWRDVTWRPRNLDWLIVKNTNPSGFLN